MGGSSSAEWEGYEAQLLGDKELRSYFVPESEAEGCSATVRNVTAKEKFGGFIKGSGDGDEKEIELDTAWKLYRHAVINNGSKPFAGYRPFLDAGDPSKRGDYKWMTYDDFNKLVLSIGNGMKELGFESATNVGIFSSNRLEWFAIHCANISQSYRTVALYDTLGPQAVSFITRHAGLPIIFCEKDKLKAVFEACKEESTSDEEKDEMDLKLKYVICVDHNEVFGNAHEVVSEDERKQASDLGLTLLGLSELIAKSGGKTDVSPPKSEDVAYIMYTSGTTGNPKGVMLSHRAFGATCASAHRVLKFANSDVHLSYLPLAHIFESMAETVFSAAGARIAYYQGDIRKLAKDWQDCRPTVLIGVPRVFSKTYDKFQMKVKASGGFKQWLVGNAQESSHEAIKHGKRSSFYDKLVWSKVPPQLGFERVRLVVSGAAPLPPYLAEFLRVILPEAQVIQGYGMTENCAGCTAVQLDDLNLGHVGVPMDNMEVRLVDAPECGYLVTDKPHPRGEIVCRGLCLMDGYYKDAEKTAETIKDGWLHTGDIGRINPNGTISIIDRRKNMFKTSQAEYIASEKVEEVYKQAPLVGQMFLYGNSFKSFVVAIVVPDASSFEPIFREKGLWTKADGELAPGTQAYTDYFMSIAEKQKDFVKSAILKQMREVESDLKSFEKVKDIAIEIELDELQQGFHVGNDLMTPTFKVKRPQCKTKYLDVIKELYTKNGDPPKEDETW